MPTTSQWAFLAVDVLLLILLTRKYPVIRERSLLVQTACTLWAVACVVGIIAPLVLRSWGAASLGMPLLALGCLVGAVAAIRGDSFDGLNRL